MSALRRCRIVTSRFRSLRGRGVLPRSRRVAANACPRWQARTARLWHARICLPRVGVFLVCRLRETDGAGMGLQLRMRSSEGEEVQQEKRGQEAEDQHQDVFLGASGGNAQRLGHQVQSPVTEGQTGDAMARNAVHHQVAAVAKEQGDRRRHADPGKRARRTQPRRV